VGQRSPTASSREPTVLIGDETGKKLPVKEVDTQRDCHLPEGEKITLKCLPVLSGKGLHGGEKWEKSVRGSNLVATLLRMVVAWVKSPV